MWQGICRKDGTWELVNVKGGYIVNQSGMTSKSQLIILAMSGYMEYRVQGNLPSHICRDLDYILSQGENYCPCKIKVPLV